ncbi:MAG: hypothetical protein ACOX1X_04220 [Dethiobacteria bacterium]|jgi:hypothetical protein
MLLLKKRITIEWEKVIFPVLFLLLAILAYFNLMILNNTSPGKILQTALQKMERNNSRLEMEILERGQAYKIDFQGDFKNKAIYGRLPAYGLEVYKHASGALFVKDLKDGLWKKAPELELQSLEKFFVSPFELLTTWSHLFNNAKFVNYAEEKEKVILLNIPATELDKKTFLQSYPQSHFSRLECLIFLEPDDLFINQIVLSLHDNQEMESVFARTFSFKYSTENINEIMPAGVEQLLKDITL